MSGRFRREKVTFKRANNNGNPAKAKGKEKNCVYLDETRKAGLDIILQSFIEDESSTEYQFPSSLAKEERAYIHTTAPKMGLSTKSKGSSNRFITVTKRSAKTNKESKCTIRLQARDLQTLSKFLARFPVTEDELRDVLPTEDRKTNTQLTRNEQPGQLARAPPQVPSLRSNKALEGHRRSLPTWMHKDRIVQHINKNQVMLLVGDTGSGKTTQVPQYILEHHAKKKQPVRIICTQPRRIAAISVAERVAQERGEDLGDTIGYQIRLESRVSSKTLVTFCTTGVLLRTLMYSKAALQCVTHLIIDEIHERDKFCDFLLGVIKSRLAEFPQVRIVLMSAALDVHLLSSYFSNCPVLTVEGRLFPVHELFLEDVLKVTDYLGNVSHVYDAAKKLKPLQDHGKRRNYPRSPVTADPDLDSLLNEAWNMGSPDSFDEILQAVCSCRMDVDYRHSVTRMTPLMIASGRGNLEVVRVLLEYSADPLLDVQLYGKRWDSLSFAKHFKESEVLEVLEESAQKADSLKLEKKEMTDDDKALVRIYQERFNDEVIDAELIIRILAHIEETGQEGAVLVFLPGYEDIVSLRDQILYNDMFYAARNFLVYTLHSSMQSSDQRKIFQQPPRGKRKIILSTNLAETSVTIDDVVFVIDAGKVKEKSYDGHTGASALKAEWISQASAIQRKGRAGRCRPGVCFRLYSSARFSTFKKFQRAEILRVPLEELCLQSKILAPPGTPIVDFLSNVPEAPPSVILRRALTTLRAIDAIDADENVTDLGRLLLEFPVEPRFGKMLLTAAVLRCVDPVATIVACLSYRDPFVLPASAEDRKLADKGKAELSAGFSSDHVVLLRTFQLWLQAKQQGRQIEFSRKYFVSNPAMEIIQQLKAQVMDQFRKSGIVLHSEKMNENADNVDALRAALAAGLYPNVARFRGGIAETPHEPKAKIRSPALSCRNASMNSDWLVYEELTRHKGINPTVQCCTVISPLTVAIFAGHARLPADSVVAAPRKPRAEYDDSSQDSSEFTEEDSLSDSDFLEGIENLKITREFLNNHLMDSEELDLVFNGSLKNPAVFKIDPWIKFQMEKEAAEVVFRLRQKWQALFIRRVRDPCWENDSLDEEILRTLLSLTRTGDRLSTKTVQNRERRSFDPARTEKDKKPLNSNDKLFRSPGNSDIRTRKETPTVRKSSNAEVKAKISKQKEDLKKQFSDPTLFPSSIAEAIYGSCGPVSG